ncbi:MAG TPA: class E sortase [Candidatus Saccharimonadales bacterium]|jgi:sortase A
MLVNVFAPAALYVIEPTDAVAKKLTSVEPELSENKVYVPKINVEVPVVEINGDETKALELGAVHRSPGSGNPEEGGNFVLAAHRFNLGFTPAQTKAKSPFYYINRLNQGDDVFVDYGGTRYAYKITERKTVSQTAVGIEARTDDDRLTLYSCELSGPENGREVVIAKQVGTITWAMGEPRLKAVEPKTTE